MEQMDKLGMNVIGSTPLHFGGLHCATADVYREGCEDFANQVADPTLV